MNLPLNAFGQPQPHGLYDPRFEHDACGVSFVADIHGRASHSIVSRGLGALCNLEHRGATGAEADTGDGAGVLIQIPDRFLRAVVDFELPAVGAYAVGVAFLPAEASHAKSAMRSIESIVSEEGLKVAGWREVPVDPSEERGDGELGRGHREGEDADHGCDRRVRPKGEEERGRDRVAGERVRPATRSR